MLYTISTLCCFTGFFMLYNTSLKAKLSASGKMEKWMQANPGVARIIGSLLIITCFTLFILKMGTAVGIFTGVLLLMAASSLVISIAPLHYFKLRHILMIVCGSLLIEYLFL